MDNLVFVIIPPLLKGAAVTLQVMLQASLLAFIISVVTGLLREISNPLVRFPIAFYVEFFRGTSAFVQIYWAYFALPLLGVKLSAIECGVIVLALNVGAYGSEVIRGALKAIPRGQREACIALNLPDWVIFIRILLPQAMIRIIIPFSNLLIDLLKGTSLLSVITVTELAFAGRQTVSAQGDPLTIFGVVLLIYLILAAPIAWGAKKLDERVSRKLAVGMVS